VHASVGDARERGGEGVRPWSAAALEAVVVGIAGALLGGIVLGRVGLGREGAVIGALNGALGGWRGTYPWRRLDGWVAFALDTTWASPLTLAALVTHLVAALQRDRGGYVDALSRRTGRHVYARGFRVRRGFLVTIGNAVHGAGPNATVSARRQRLVEHHEHVHVWQGRWLGPLYPLLYGAWMVVGGVVGAVLAVTRLRGRAPFTKVVETCAYYLNPFEWWAYSRDGTWPPPGKVTGLGWRAPIVPPFSASRQAARRARPAPPASPR
jgi:hypothetical protein